MGERRGRARRHADPDCVQRYVLNPPVKVAVWTGLVPGYVLVETTGRRTGKRRRNVVGMHVDGEHRLGRRRAGPARRVRRATSRPTPGVRVRLRGHWRHGARGRSLVDDDRRGAPRGSSAKSHAATVRRFGTELTTIRFDLDAWLTPPRQRSCGSGR